MELGSPTTPGEGRLRDASLVGVIGFILVIVAWALGGGLGCGSPPGPDPNIPSVTQPPTNAQVKTSMVYVEVEVLENEVYEVWLRQNLANPATDITALFTFSQDPSGTKIRYHANVPVPVGTHEAYAVQRKAGVSTTWTSENKRFSRVAGPVTERGALTGGSGGTVGQVVAQAALGVVSRTTPADRLFVFGETQLNGGTTHAATLALSTDTMPSDGLALSYFDQGGSGTIDSVLPLVAGETAVELGTPFLDGTTVYALYRRLHAGGSTEVGLAQMAGGTPPLTRVTFATTSALFGDNYSLFETSELKPVGGALVSGSDVYLYGAHRPSGATSDQAFVARVPLNAVQLKTSYEYWTGTSWQAAPPTPASLWAETGPPSVQWNVQRARWVALHSVEQRTILPYGVGAPHSAIAVREAKQLQGPWSAAVVVWERPQTRLTGLGSAFRPLLVPGLESGSTIVSTANDDGEWTRAKNAYLYEVDLNQIVFPPVLDLPPDPTNANPHTVTGFAHAGDLVRVYVNGVEKGSATANASDGTFSIPVPLFDGPNSVYATAAAGATVSDPSTVLTFTYVNNINRSLTTPTINADTVWTPGAAPGVTGPYVIDGTLTVAAGKTLTLYPGAVLQFDTSSPSLDKITVNGTLRIEGSATNGVTLTRSTTSGNWGGITVQSGGSAFIDRATIEYANIALTVNETATAAATAIVSNTTVRLFTATGISVVSGGRLTITSAVTVTGPSKTGTTTGVRFQASGTSSVNGLTVQLNQTGIDVTSGSSPTVTGSLVQNNGTGIRVAQSLSSPTVTTSTITGNANGVNVVGANPNPVPSIRNNNIHSNDSMNFTGTSFTNAVTTTVDARDNWWGTSVDPEAIASKIEDQSDSATSSSRPVVDWSGFRQSNAFSSPPVAGNYLVGPAPATIAAQTYTVLGDLFVLSGGSATVAAGAQLRFLPGTRLFAQGTLAVAGTISAPASLKSSKAAPAAGDWEGVLIDASSTNSRIEFAVVEHARRGIEVQTATVEVVDSTILSFGRSAGASTDTNVGVLLNDSASSVLRTTIDNAGVSHVSSGIRVTWGTDRTKVPLLDGNTVRNTWFGLNIEGASSGTPVGIQILWNLIESNEEGLRIERGVGAQGDARATVSGNLVRNNNDYGVRLEASGIDPFPSITGNDIHGNGLENLYVGNLYDSFQTAVVTATGNWWGSPILSVIRAGITDQLQNSSAAVVDWSSPLDNSIMAGGMPIPGSFLFGALPPETVLTSGTTYEVLSKLRVAANRTLTIPAGATLRFAPGTVLEVDGVLTLQGGLLTSGASTQMPGDWEGIVINSTGSGTTLADATIQYADDPIRVNGANVSISNVSVSSFRPASGLPSTAHAGIRFSSSASGSIDGCTIDNADAGGIGIQVQGSSPAISGNTLRNLGIGLELGNSTSSVTGNTIESNGWGVNLQIGAHPAITGGNAIQCNTLGIRLDGTPGSPGNPKPIINGNRILNNNAPASSSGCTSPAEPFFNISALEYGTVSPTNPLIEIDADLNYWGSTEPAEFRQWLSADTNNPEFKTNSWLDQDMIPQGGANLLYGTPPTTLTELPPGEFWSMIDDVIVPAGVTLVVEAGAVVKAAPGTKLTVNGSIEVSGTTTKRAVFLSSEAAPTTGSWEGIWIGTGGTAVIDWADIRHGRHAVSAVNANGIVSVTNTLFTDFGRGQGSVFGAGVWIQSSQANLVGNTFTHPLPLNGGTDGIHMVQATAGSTVVGNTIQGVTRGIYLDRSSPEVETNTISGNATGIHVIGNASSPSIENQNVIRDNEWGIQIVGTGNPATSPAPIIEGNDIFSNDEAGGSPLRNLTASSFGTAAVEIDASNNWWGSTVVTTIAGGIFDRTDPGGTTAPYVDFVPFLDASVTAGGAPVPGNFLAGAVTGPTTLAAGTWDLVGSLAVTAGGTLTIPAGTTLRALDGASLDVAGTLNVQGTAVNPVVLTSQTASRGAWEGVELQAGASATIDHAEIAWADRAVFLNGASATISNTWIHDFATAAIWVTNGGGTFSGNTIDNVNDTGTGIHLTSSSPSISDNDIRNTLIGISMHGTSNPTVNGHNVVTSNRVGIQLNGGVNGHPNPVVNDNDIFDNVWVVGDVRNLELSGYYDPNNPNIPATLDFRRNWWDSQNPADILAGIEDKSLQPAAVDVSNFLTSAGGSPSSTVVFAVPVSNVTRSVTLVSPGLGGTVAIGFDLYTNATVTLKIFDEDDGSVAAPVRSITAALAAGAGQSLVWNGRNDAGQFVDEGPYGYALTATDAVGTFTWNPSRPIFSGSMEFVPGAETFNTYQNDFWQRQVNFTKTRRFELRVTPRPPATFTPFNILTKKVLPAGSHKLVWDGRNLAGVVIADPVAISLIQSGTELLHNHLIVDNVEPNVTGPAPVIEVKSNPWYLVHSYGQLSRFTYHIDHPCLVTVKILPPGIGDPAHPSAVVLKSGAPEAPGDYTVEWTGPGAADPNLVRVAEEGAFTFAIQATSQTTGRTTTYRGVLQLRR